MLLFRLVAFLGSAAALQGAPSISAVRNAASNIPAGLPNGAIAQGALFILQGAGLGPAVFAVTSDFPLPRSLAGTLVRVGGVDAIVYYSGASQVAAILPSTVPAGPALVTVTYNGQPSAPFPMTVVPSAIGVFTISQTGSGDAIASIGAAFLTPANSAHPGDIVTMWGTGLGPVAFDESRAAQQIDMTGVPVEAYIGGRQAEVVFRGRNACCAAVDTIYVRIPAGVTGCVTPVTFKVGSVVSNTTTIPVATDGRTCTPSFPGLSQNDLTGFFAKKAISSGFLYLTRLADLRGGNFTRADIGGGAFTKVSVPPGASGLASLLDVPSFGSCTVSSATGGVAAPLYPSALLDAGPLLDVSGPAGSKSISKIIGGDDVYYAATLDAAANYLNQGDYTVSGPGGPDVGHFSAQLSLPQPTSWTNQEAILAVNRAAGVTLFWSGGDPGGYMEISGSSALADGATGAFFTCTAKVSDGSFTLPPYVLLPLPPGLGRLSVAGVGGITRIEANGLDYGAVASASSASIVVEYQ